MRWCGAAGTLRPALALLALVATGPTASAELALLDNGQVLKVAAWRDEGPLLVLRLVGGGEVGVAPERLRAMLPDEIDDPQTAELQDGGSVSGSPVERVGLESLAFRVAEKHGVDPALVLAVIAVESAFQPAAVSPKGARGLMQLMPATARDLGVSDAFDPEQNLDGGVRHLRELLGRYDGDLSRALAAYNAGAASVERHGGVPPFRETREYVAAVMQRYRGGSE